METLPTTCPDEIEAFEATPTAVRGTFKGIRKVATAEDMARVQAAKKEKIERWKATYTRQDFADEGFVRSILVAAGLRVATSIEPATVGRLRSMLRKVDIQGAETREAVGTSIEGFLELNPNLPLWAALAIILESTGRFDNMAYAGQLNI